MTLYIYIFFFPRTEILWGSNAFRFATNFYHWETVAYITFLISKAGWASEPPEEILTNADSEAPQVSQESLGIKPCNMHFNQTVQGILCV